MSRHPLVVRSSEEVWLGVTGVGTTVDWTSSKRRLSKSGKTPRFVPDTRLGTDRGRSVQLMRVSDGWFPAAHHGRGNQLFCVSDGRQMETIYVPNFNAEDNPQRQQPMEGEKLHMCSLPRARDDCPLLAEHAAVASCFSSPSQPLYSLTTHTLCWLCPLWSQAQAC